MEDDLKLQDFDQWVKIFILKHEGENLSKESKILGHPIVQSLKFFVCFDKMVIPDMGSNCHHPLVVDNMWV